MPEPIPRCTDCGHDVELHRSTGCLWRLGECPCRHDMRPPAGAR